MKGPMLLCFFSLKGSTLRKIPPFLSVHQLRTAHEYNMCILAMFTIFRKYGKHVNWPSLKVSTLYISKCETRRESAVKLWFSYDIVFDDEIHLRPYILILIRVKS